MTGDIYYNPTDSRGLSYSNVLSEDIAAEIGGYYDRPGSGSTISLYHAAPGELQYLSFTVDFGMQKSVYPLAGKRDGFGFSFHDDNDANLLTISLVPAVSTLNNSFQVCYTVGAEPMAQAKDANGDNMFVYYSGLYQLKLDFTPNGANPLFSGTVTGSNTQTFTGTATGLGSKHLLNFGAEWNVTDVGNNGMIFDNLSVVPEPSSALLFGMAGLGLAMRRRRA